MYTDEEKEINMGDFQSLLYFISGVEYFFLNIKYSLSCNRATIFLASHNFSVRIMGPASSVFERIFGHFVEEKFFSLNDCNLIICMLH